MIRGLRVVRVLPVTRYTAPERFMIPFSVLDLAPIRQGDDRAAEAFRNTRELARQVESLGYQRYWLAEHHNMTGIGSAATAVLIGHVAEHTEKIRVGSGGVMLPNHSPLVVAEQFGTLEALHPGRIDLGLGRAPGTDPETVRALRRDRAGGPEQFPRDLVELRDYFLPAGPDQTIRAVPGAGLRVPLWMLGSSTSSARLAGQLGLPYAFASHFAPDQLMDAAALYREHFEPSEQLDEPWFMPVMNVLVADTQEQADYLFTSAQQQFCEILRGRAGPIPPPVEDMSPHWGPMEKAGVARTLHYSAVGDVQRVREAVTSFVEAAGADELMVQTLTWDPQATRRSFELLAQVRDQPDQP
jgi:luciferase family oxidoreductase group 1